MTAEEFFTELVIDAVGTEVSADKIIYRKNFDGKDTWVATLEKHKGLKMLWVNWVAFYYPMVKHYKMTEDQVTTLIMNKMNVDLIGRMPSLTRLMMIEKGETSLLNQNL